MLPALDVSLLTQAGRAVVSDPDLDGPTAVEQLIKAAIEQLGGGSYGEAAACLFGLAAGTRNLPVGTRQERAAVALACSFKTFRTRRMKKMEYDIAGRMVLLLEAQGDGLAQDEARVPSLEGDVESAQPTTTVCVTVGFDPLTGGRGYTTTLQGDLHAWYMAMVRAKTGHQAMPTTQVLVVSEGAVRQVALSTGDEPTVTAESQLRELETRITSWYDRSSEDFVREICRLAIQYFGLYYPDPEPLAEVITTILYQGWIRAGDSVTELTARPVFDADHSIAIYVPNSILKERLHLSDSEYDAVRSALGWYVVRHLPWLTDLGDDYLRAIVIPAIICRWLEVPAKYDPMEYFDLARWHLV
jgi:hypothetical protein